MDKIIITPPIAILGFGAEGRHALEFLQKQGISDITIRDEKTTVQIPAGIKSKLGPGAFDDLTEFRTIIRSPGVRYRLPSIQKAIEAGCHVTSMTKLTLEAASDRVTAVTGTNGKTTTVALATQILSAYYKCKLVSGGNGQKPVLSEILLHPHWPILIEASSFQFEDMHVSPHIAVVTNITPDHQNWHANMEEYVAAKTNILKHQKPSDWAILNANNENSARLHTATKAQIFWVGQKKGRNWAVWEGDWLTIGFDENSEGAIQPASGGRLQSGNNKPIRVLNRSELVVKTHPDNLLFAAAIATIHQAPVAIIAKEMKTFKGVEMRLEFVRTVNGIHFYNDSAATTPEAALVAISQFDPKKLILLLGGSTKNADFTYLAKAIVEKGVRVYLYGKEGARIKEAIGSASGKSTILAYDQTGDFRHTIQTAFSFTKSDDIIVLSPACASFDMFKNSVDRSNQFKEIVSGL